MPIRQAGRSRVGPAPPRRRRCACRLSRDQCEHAPPEVRAREGRILLRLGRQQTADLVVQLVVRVGVRPAAHGQPLRSLVAIPGLLGRAGHLHDVVALCAERRQKVRQGQVVLGSLHPAPGQSLRARGNGAPVRLTDQQHPAGLEAPAQQVEGARHPAADPRRAHARRDVHGLVDDVAGRVGLDEPDRVAHTELIGAGPGVGDEVGVEVHAQPGDPVIARPGGQQLTGPAGQVEDARAGRQVERGTEGGELSLGQGVVDAVVGLTDGEDAEVEHDGAPCPSRSARRGADGSGTTRRPRRRSPPDPAPSST